MAQITEILENIALIEPSPLLKINEIPLPEQNFVWAKTPGALPYTTTIDVPVTFGKQMRALNGAQKIIIEYKGGLGIENFDKSNRITIDKVFLHEPKQITEFVERWQVSDIRWLLRGRKCFFSYNETRIKNEIGILNPTQLKQSIDTNPAVLRAPFDIFATGRYVAASIKSDGTPFRFFEILKRELLAKGITLRIRTGTPQADYVMENIRAEGEDFYTCISTLLAKCRMQIGINLSGDLDLYSVDFFDIGNIRPLIDVQNSVKADIGTLYVENKRNTRPEKVTVRFEKMIETRIALVDAEVVPRGGSTIGNPRKLTATIVPTSDVSTQTNIDQQTTIGCINVVKAQFIPNEFLGLYNIGEYVEIKEYLSLFGLTEDLLRETFFGDILRKELSFFFLNPTSFQQEGLAGAIASNIKSSYRQLFMIDPYFLDRIKNWEDKRVEIVDFFSGYRPPSPTFMDYTVIPKVRDLQQVRGETNNFQTKSVRINDFDPKREKDTLFSINVVNPSLGIFAVSSPPITDTTVAENIPSALEEDVPINPTFGGDPFLSGAKLAVDHTMETLVSVVWNYDPRDKFDSSDIVLKDGKYHDIVYNFLTGNAQFGPSLGPEVEFLSNREFARYNKDLELVNDGIINAIADAEVAKIMNRYKDRIAGYITLPFFVDFPLLGNLQTVTYTMSPNTGFTTSIDVTQPPFDPTVESQLSDSDRQYLYKQLNNFVGQ